MLLEAFTLIVRQDIRKEMRSIGTELPEEPFENRILESEVFMKAKFLAENEAEEQMNQAFYIWYKSKTRCSVVHGVFSPPVYLPYIAAAV